MPKISVILPCFNEGAHIERVVRNVSNLLEHIVDSHELILVDDGSSDNTRKKALKQCASIPLKVIGYDHNMGKGYALKYGSKFLSGEITVFLDSDTDIRPSNLGEYLRSLGTADIVIASKRHPHSNVKQPVVRKILGLGFHIMVKLLTNIQVSDTQSGLKAFRTEAIRRIMPLLSVKKYAFDVELLTVASLLNMRVVELPVDIELQSMFRLRNVSRMIIDLLGIAYRLRIIRWYHKNLNRDARYNPLIKL